MHHSIIQGLKLFLWELSCIFYPLFFCIPLLNTIHHLFHTFTAGWRPESNRASFLMMFPTPGMTAWSRRTSQSILLPWLLTASSEREKLNVEEHTSRLSVALTLCSQSSVNLQTHSCRKKVENLWRQLLKVCHEVNWCSQGYAFQNCFFHIFCMVCLFVMRWNSIGETFRQEK